MLTRAGLPDAELDIVAAELNHDDGWPAAVAGTMLP
jgi:hypothetical protein